MKIYNNVIPLLEKYSISYKIYEHLPILNYDDAEREKNNHKWQGVESKNVFMTNGKGKYFLFVSIFGEKVDFKSIKNLIGEKLFLASAQEVKDIALSTPGCVCLFGFEENIFLIIDKKIFSYEKYLFSQGIPTKTIELNPNDLLAIFNEVENKIFV